MAAKKVRGGVKKKALFRSLLLQRGPDPPIFVIRWESGSDFFWKMFHVVVDAIGLETDFTLETNRKRVKEKLLKTTLKTRISPFGP